MATIKQPKTIQMVVDEIKINPKNPRIIDRKKQMALKKSLTRWGNVGVLVWNERTGMLVGGEQRLKLLKKEGVKKTSVVVVDLPEEEERALMVELNNRFSQGDWDVEKALQQIKEIEVKMPDVYDDMAFSGLRTELEMEVKKALATYKEEEGIPEMEIMPYEHWDYIVLVFRDSRDWLRAAELFGIRKEKVMTASGKSKVGLGRVIKGERLLELMEKEG